MGDFAEMKRPPPTLTKNGESGKKMAESEQTLLAAGELRCFYMIDTLWKIEADLESLKESCLA